MKAKAGAAPPTVSGEQKSGMASLRPQALGRLDWSENPRAGRPAATHERPWAGVPAVRLQSAGYAPRDFWTRRYSGLAPTYGVILYRCLGPGHQPRSTTFPVNHLYREASKDRFEPQTLNPDIFKCGATFIASMVLTPDHTIKSFHRSA